MKFVGHKKHIFIVIYGFQCEHHL